MPTPRTRSYEWRPVEGTEPPLAKMSGLEFFQRLADGRLPPQPVTSTIGWTIDEAARGMVRLRFEAMPWLFHAAGLLHGGVIATLLDSAMSGSVMSTLVQGQGCTTLQLSINHIRGVREGDGPFLIEGRATSVGRKVGVATGTMVDQQRRLFAQGTTSCMIF